MIARRAQGPTRGQILLNGVSWFRSDLSIVLWLFFIVLFVDFEQVPMSMRLFQDSCAYVGRKCHLLEGLTTKQTLYYAAHLTIGKNRKINHNELKENKKQKNNRTQHSKYLDALQ